MFLLLLIHSEDIAVKLGSAGYYDCASGCAASLENKAQMNNLLNNAPASFGGKIFSWICREVKSLRKLGGILQ